MAPDSQELDVRAQLSFPAFSRIAVLDISRLPYCAVAKPRDVIASRGTGLCRLAGVAHYVGHLWARRARKRGSASFEYDADWRANPVGFALDPALMLGGGL